METMKLSWNKETQTEDETKKTRINRYLYIW